MINLNQLAMTILLITFSFACRKQAGLRPIAEEGQLVVLTHYSTTSYMNDNDGRPTGFEYELVSAFARDKGLKATFIVKESTYEVLEALKKGEGHMAAAGLSITEQRKEDFEFSVPYQEVEQKVICGKYQKVKKTNDFEKLDLIILTGTSYEETIKEIKEQAQNIDFTTINETAEELLEIIWKDRSKCTIIDSQILNIHRRYFPELRVVYTFKNKEKLAWAFNSIDEDLKESVDQWLKGKGREQLNSLKNKYFGHTKDFDYYDIKKFLERIQTRLPKLEKFFKSSAKKTGFDWKFLAAIAYQESQWNPKAVSPTGVRGIMMLTQTTAEEMNVQNRLEPKQSIDGGSRYLKKLLNRLPPYIINKDRKWFALASYNIGYYHLRDAMALTVLKNKNPGRWNHVRQILPLLAKRKYFKNLMYGRARGLEPVIYISRIKNYYDLLVAKLEP